MATGSEWTTVLTSAIAAAPVAVVIGMAALLTVGGVIGCAKCVLGAFSSRRAEQAETAPVVGSELAH